MVSKLVLTVFVVFMVIDMINPKQLTGSTDSKRNMQCYTMTKTAASDFLYRDMNRIMTEEEEGGVIFMPEEHKEDKEEGSWFRLNANMLTHIWKR